MRRRWLPFAMGLVLTVVSATVSQADPPPAAAAKADAKAKSAHQYVRIQRDARDQPTAFQTAIVEFASNKPGQKDLRVDLVGAIHVGERPYYEELNRLFEKYDAVLYELVAPPGTRVPKGGGHQSGHPVGALQRGLKDMLDLEHQLDVVDYTKANLVHADMSPEQFSKSMDERGESFWTMFFQMMGQAMAQESQRNARGKSTDLEMLMALFDKNRAVKLKRVLADQFEGSEGMIAALDGPKGSTIISGRNKVALETLAKEIAAGKKRIAIFYGAGHLSDLERRLVEEMGLKRSSERWLTAWNLSERTAAGAK